MHFPFGLKIFGLATLLLLMAVVALLSLARIRRVNTEIASIADYKMPLTAHVRNMVVEALEQEIHQAQGPDTPQELREFLHYRSGCHPAGRRVGGGHQHR